MAGVLLLVFFFLSAGARQNDASDPCSSGGPGLEIHCREAPCGLSLSKGRRHAQEDYAICKSVHFNPPLQHELRELTMLAVFDGHDGNLASKAAAESYHKFFTMHLYALSAANGSSWKDAIEKALLMATKDVEQAFLKSVEGVPEGGTTACIAVAVRGEVIVANLGDSKALLCSPDKVVELTSDHHPDRSDEKLRVEASGGFVAERGGLARVNGILAVSRSIGDFHLKRFGLSAEPELSGWRAVEGIRWYLVLASDGVFETLGTHDVCMVIHAVEARSSVANLFKERFSSAKIPIALPPKGAKSSSEEKTCSVDFLENDGRCEWVDGLYKCIPKVATLEQQMAASISDTALQLGSGDNVASIVYALNQKKVEAEIGYLGPTFPGRVPYFHQAADIQPMVFANTNVATLLGHQVPFCYALVEPIYREFMASASKWPGFDWDSGPRQALKSAERLCASGAFGSRNDLLQLPEGRSDCGLGLDIHRERYNRRDKLDLFLDIISSVPLEDVRLQREHVVPLNDYGRAPDFVAHYKYILKKQYARGSFGEIWLAVRRKCRNRSEEKITFLLETEYSESVDEAEVFVLKQILLSDNPDISLSGLREKYFGELLLNATRSRLFVDVGLNHIARFVDSFISEDRYLWLVFRKEGQSLSKLLYTSDGAGTNKSGDYLVMRPSEWWVWTKSTREGQDEMRSLLYQLLLALKACHDRNIAHRDIKPENMVVQPGQYSSKGTTNLTLRVIDFGSAVDPFTLENLYGREGPSRKEQTAEYAPPEALLLTHWLHFHPKQIKAYDMWSVGVVMLELILGTPHVFQISSRTRALLDRSLAGWDDDSKNVAYMLRAFMEMCILIPRVPPRHQHHDPNGRDENYLASKECSEAVLSQKLSQRDPLGLGVQDVWALRLLRQLLQWYPEDRISIDEALQHPYFHSHLQAE